jgi:hypothetical protein
VAHHQFVCFVEEVVICRLYFESEFIRKVLGSRDGGSASSASKIWLVASSGDGVVQYRMEGCWLTSFATRTSQKDKRTQSNLVPLQRHHRSPSAESPNSSSPPFSR